MIELLGDTRVNAAAAVMAVSPSCWRVSEPKVKQVENTKITCSLSLWNEFISFIHLFINSTQTSEQDFFGCILFEKQWQCIFVCLCERVVLCECMCGSEEVTRTSTSFTEHIAVFIRALSGSNTEKKSELRTDGGGSPRLFFFFHVFLYFFDIFFLRVLQLWHFCGMYITSIKETVGREKKKKYTTYITLCYEQNINL